MVLPPELVASNGQVRGGSAVTPYFDAAFALRYCRAADRVFIIAPDVPDVAYVWKLYCGSKT